MSDDEAKQFIADLLGPSYRFGPLLGGVIASVRHAYSEGFDAGYEEARVTYDPHYIRDK